MFKSALCRKTMIQVGIHGPKRYCFSSLMTFRLGTLSKDKFIFEAFNYTDGFLFQKPNMKTVNGMDSERVRD